MGIDKLKFYTVDTNYVEKLYKVDTEVFYEPSNYDNKPYLGVIIVQGGYNYFIPLTSAKEKHKTWKNVSKDYYLIYEICNSVPMGSQRSICVNLGNGKFKHILSVLEIKKMIPVPNNLFSQVDFKNISNVTAFGTITHKIFIVVFFHILHLPFVLSISYYYSFVKYLTFFDRYVTIVKNLLRCGMLFDDFFISITLMFKFNKKSI